MSVSWSVHSEMVTVNRIQSESDLKWTVGQLVQSSQLKWIWSGSPVRCGVPVRSGLAALSGQVSQVRSVGPVSLDGSSQSKWPSQSGLTGSVGPVCVFSPDGSSPGWSGLFRFGPLIHQSGLIDSDGFRPSGWSVWPTQSVSSARMGLVRSIDLSIQSSLTTFRQERNCVKHWFLPNLD